MELLEHLRGSRGSVLTRPRQTALYLPIPPQSWWVGGRAWGRAGCAPCVPAHSSSDLLGMQYLNFVHWSDVASALGRGSLGAAWLQAGPFLQLWRADPSAVPRCQRQGRKQLLDSLPSPVCAPRPPSSGWDPPLRHSLAPLGAVGTPPVLCLPISPERCGRVQPTCLPGLPLPLPGACLCPEGLNLIRLSI